MYCKVGSKKGVNTPDSDAAYTVSGSSCFHKCHLKWKENDTQLQQHAKGEIPFIKLSTG